ncbi:hypothetical protein [Cytobacillus dafuensis]|uniref:Uncharacterized protein n=1 Tax=Cytobacillus dafuensis TaxID=1742359 RepID=A0A5B8Z2S1_CYTDA|nr:hypothetical protein [Cytobacillus dafuensis]QED47380.1 hypothetical protein FSZ17_09030 [Cytobacillus dafuensis]
MLRKKLLIFGIISLAITIMSPFMFYSYIEKKPNSLQQNITFGGPFPFAEQMVTLPADKKLYPLEVKFESPFEKQTKYKATPFLFSFICFYLFLFALYSIVTRFFISREIKEPE